MAAGLTRLLPFVHFARVLAVKLAATLSLAGSPRSRSNRGLSSVRTTKVASLLRRETSSDVLELNANSRIAAT